jgi:hypothetical protein
MNAKQVLMTPEWAATLLELNTSNRRLSPPVIAKYAKEIEDGDWKLTHQGVAIDWDGVIQDGQHRLHAIIRTGKSVPIMLFTGCDPAVFAVLDTGYKRTAGHMLGIEGVSCQNAAAAVIRCLMLYETMPNMAWTGPAAKRSHSQILGWHRTRSMEVQAAVTDGSTCRKRFPLIKASPLSVFIYLVRDSGWEEKRLAEFLAQLCDGVGLEAGNPVFSFRRFLINNPHALSATGIGGTQLAATCLIGVFNAWTEGKIVKTFKTPPYAPMPVVVKP